MHKKSFNLLVSLFLIFVSLVQYAVVPLVSSQEFLLRRVRTLSSPVLVPPTVPPVAVGAATPSPGYLPYDFAVIGGGSGTNAFAKGFSQLGSDKTLAMIPTVYDDGGDTKKIIDALYKKCGFWLYGIGDVVLMMLGSTSPYKKMVLDKRFPSKEGIDSDPTIVNARLEDKMKEILVQVEADVRARPENNGQLPSNWPADWAAFSASMIELAKIYDKEMIDTGVLNLENAAVKNRIFVAQLFKSGFLTQQGTNSDNLDKSLEEFSRVLGIDKSWIAPASLGEATLLAYYADGTVIPKQTFITEVKVDSPLVRIALGIRDPNGAIAEKIIDKTTGNIIDKPNGAKYRELTRDEALYPTATPQAVALIENAKDAILMGPGSVGTSLIPNLLLKTADGRTLAEVIASRTDIPRVFVVNPFYDYETAGYKSPLEYLKAIENSIHAALGEQIKVFGENGIFNHVYIPQNLGANQGNFTDIANLGTMTDYEEIKRIIEANMDPKEAAKSIALLDQYRNDPNFINQLFENNGTLKGAKIPRGILTADDATLAYLKSQGVMVHDMGPYEIRVEGAEVRIIDPNSGKTTIIKLPTVNYDMTRFIKQELII